MIKITITPETIERVTNWAKKCYITNKRTYDRRRQSNPETCIQQIAQGKIAEEAVYIHLKDQVQAPPDYTIYEEKRKSYDPDFIYQDGTPIHVKSQSRYEPGFRGNSWVFAIKDDLKGKVVLTTVVNNDVYIEYILDAENLIYSPPFSERLRHFKKVVYAYDIEEL